MRIAFAPVLLFTFFLLMTPKGASAQPKYLEIVERRALIRLDDLQQSLTLRYDYRGYDADFTSSQENRFTERYQLFSKFTVWDPDLLFLNANLGVSLSQRDYSSEGSDSTSSDNNRFLYDLGATAFNNSVHPVYLYTSLEEEDVTTSYSPTYTTTTARHGVIASYWNRLVPLRVNYQHTNTEASGGNRDTTTTMDTLTFSANHHYRAISSTELYVNWSEQQLESAGGYNIDSSVNSISLSNGLNLGRYSLSSALHWSEGETDGDNFDSLKLTEQLRIQFGAALVGEANYEFEDYTTAGFVSNDTDNNITSHRLELALNHWLYKSLHTRVSGHIKESDIYGGTESQNRQAISFGYRKQLPEESRLNLFLGLSRLETERDLPLTSLTKTQTFEGFQQGDRLSLDIGGRLVIVDNVTGVAPGRPVEFYQEDEDYEVNYDFGTIEIIIGGDITEDVTLRVVYVDDVEPRLDNAVNTFGLSGSLSLFEGRYVIQASHYRDDTSRDSNIATGEDSVMSNRTELRFDARFENYRYSLEYENYQTDTSGYDAVAAEVYFDRTFPRYSYSLYARDRYTMYDATNGGSSASVNTFGLGGTYKYKVFSWASMQMGLSYVITSTEDVTRSGAQFRAAFIGRYGDLSFSLIGTTLLRMNEDLTTRDDFLSFEVTRYF